MLEVIEKIATKSMNPAVDQMNFGNLMQSEGKSIKVFLIRICPLTMDCEFNCPVSASKTNLSVVCTMRLPKQASLQRLLS